MLDTLFQSEERVVITCCCKLANVLRGSPLSSQTLRSRRVVKRSGAGSYSMPPSFFSSLFLRLSRSDKKLKKDLLVVEFYNCLFLFALFLLAFAPRFTAFPFAPLRRAASYMFFERIEGGFECLYKFTAGRLSVETPSTSLSN